MASFSSKALARLIFPLILDRSPIQNQRPKSLVSSRQLSPVFIESRKVYGIMSS
ncbi:hypothetical protein Lser_V15G42322 [Lactuca serriola]